MQYIKKFEEISLADVALVGGKNASLGQMIQGLQSQGIIVPTGFAITAEGYWHYIQYNNVLEPLKQAMHTIHKNVTMDILQKSGLQARSLIMHGKVPDDLAQEIVASYHALSAHYNVKNADVAVRSSATAEDLPTASFAGQQETYLNIHSEPALIEGYKKCVASLFTDRAIMYRIEQGYDHFKVALSVGIQKMIRSDLACSGVAFSVDTETGFKDVVMIETSYGLGETIVKGLVVPDQYYVYKPLLAKGACAIIKKQLGEKINKLIYSSGTDSVYSIGVPKADQKQFCLTDEEVVLLARMVVTIEKYYSSLKNSWCPMDIEWAKDGTDGKLYIIQARPETVQSQQRGTSFTTYTLKNGGKNIVCRGLSIGQKIVSGPARVIEHVSEIDQLKQGEILVTVMTDPDWVPVMKKAAGIITERGGRTCHAAIVSRELGIPAIVGADDVTKIIKTGQQVTIDCSQGKIGLVYDGLVAFETQEITVDELPQLPVELMVNMADPDGAFNASVLPVNGVGLARIEFIISNSIKVHPMALVHPEKIVSQSIAQQINDMTAAYDDKKQFFVDTLARGIAMIAAAFTPRPVIVRLSDFKSNEYRNLIGGTYFEPDEENPMIGFRGAFRYYHERYQEAFALECAALRMVRNEMNFTNVKIMVPFVRTLDEAHSVMAEMKKNGLERNKDGLEIYMMVEIPSNVILIDQFSALFDGFSIGSNDLTQLTLGVDRDSELLATQFDERDASVQQLLKMAVEGAKRNNIHSGICGQAPSDYPEIAQFLIDCGIDSISLNVDSVVPFLRGKKK